MRRQDERHLLPTEYPLEQSIQIYWKRFLLILTIALGNLLALLIFMVFRSAIGFAILALLALLVILMLLRSRIHTTMLERYRLHLINLQVYWRISAVLRTVEFRRTRITLRWKERFSGWRSGVPILIQLMWLSAKVSSLGVVIALLILLSAYHGQDGTIHWLIEDIAPSAESSYDAALIAIITVTGVVLTLYFSNLNALIGSLYAELPERIRELLLKDRASNLTIAFVTSLAVYSLTTLAGGTLHGLRSNASILLAVAWTILAIPTLALLARRTFAFFNPTYLADTIVYDLDKITDDLTDISGLVSDPSVQNYSMTRASEAFTALSILASVAVSKEDLRRDALTKLLAKISGLLYRYLQRKPSIPFDSRWYRRVPEHKDWYLASSTEVTLALSTHTGLQPSWNPDYAWLEDTCVSILHDTMEKLLVLRDYSRVGNVLLISAEVCESMGACYQVQISSGASQSVHRMLMEHLESAHDINPLLRLQILDYLNLLPVRTLLGFFKSLVGFDLCSILTE